MREVDEKEGEGITIICMLISAINVHIWDLLTAIQYQIMVQPLKSIIKLKIVRQL